MAMRRVLVTGAGGFIGMYTCAVLAAMGCEVIAAGRSRQAFASFSSIPLSSPFYQLDINSVQAATDLVRHSAPNILIHLAGTSSVQKSLALPVEDFHHQVLPTLYCLEAVRKYSNSCHFLFVSSAAVYGDPVELPIKEDAKLAPISPYGFHKVQQESMVEEYSRIYKIPCAIARIFSTYGPGLRHLAVWGIVHRALLGDYTIQGTGLESRDYLYIEDVAAALAHICLNSQFEAESYNVGSGEETSIEQLAKTIYELLALPNAPRFLGAADAGKPIRWRADIAKLKAIGFVPRVDVYSGLQRTVNWIRNNV